MRPRSLVGLLVLLCLAAASPLLAADVAPGPAARVQRWLDSWSRLSGRFEQILTSPTLPEDQVESGRFQVERPDRMRWDYRRPQKKLAVSDGVHTWLYIPADRQVLRGSLKKLRADSAVALLLSGSLRLQEAFTVEEVAVTETELTLTLLPRQPSDNIREVRLRARAEDGEVLGFRVTDPSGNHVTYRFWDLASNPQLQDDLFVFRIPPGVEVQEIDAQPEGAP